MNTVARRIVTRRYQSSALLRQKLIPKSGGRCAICGANFENSVLQLAHIVPLSAGGATTEDNLLVVCPTCHVRLDRAPREIEFSRFLEDMLRRHPDYSEIKSEVVLGRSERFRADVIAKRQRNGREEILLIECKTPQALSSKPITTVVTQLNTYRSLLGKGWPILAVPATIPSSDVAVLASAGIEIWDLTYLIDNFSKQAKHAPATYYGMLVLAQNARRSQVNRERQLINDMRACRAGREDWRLYQSLVGEILECLFTPALSKPIFELSDKARANRRDYILPNYAETGFWASMRNVYKADYIVIDAKNSTKTLTKADVLQMANYLKPHGAGLFGVIICRRGANQVGCQQTVREEWQQHKKLILILNDDDIEAMLMAKAEGRAPEDLVSLRIQQFRLSM